MHVDDDPYFSRDGSDVYTQCGISLSRALLGGSVKVRGLEGDIKVKIPDAVFHGERVRLKGKGFVDLHRGGKGDHFVEFQLRMPSSLTERQRELMQQFEAEELAKTGEKPQETSAPKDDQPTGKATDSASASSEAKQGEAEGGKGKEEEAGWFDRLTGKGKKKKSDKDA